MNADIREQFPILKRVVDGNPLIYFDNAATTQKPSAVIEAIVEYYSNHNANIHRASHTLANEATNLWVEVHRSIAKLINADSYEEIIFVRNSTEGLNLVVNSLGREILERGDVVAISEMEHHSNIVPWQLLSKEKGFRIEWIPVNKEGFLEFDYLEFLVRKYGERLKFLSVLHQSNVMDTLLDFKKLKEIVRKNGTLTILDASQSITHMKIDVKELDPDFLVFSGHKMYGPTGSGALYGRRELLQKMSPWMGGGEMIRSVSKTESTWNDLPWKFEAGTPNIEGGVGLMRAINWFEENINHQILRAHMQKLVKKCIDGLLNIPGVTILGPLKIEDRHSLISFQIKDLHAHDIAQIANESGIAIRGGFHCAQPLHDKLSISSSARVSFGIYNLEEEVETFIESLDHGVRKLR